MTCTYRHGDLQQGSDQTLTVLQFFLVINFFFYQPTGLKKKKKDYPEFLVFRQLQQVSAEQTAARTDRIVSWGNSWQTIGVLHLTNESSISKV